MATPSRDDPADLESIRGSPGGPVCFHRVLPLPVILLPDQALLKYAFPPVSLLAQTLCKSREDKEQVLLVTPFWPTRIWFSGLMLLMTAPPWRILLRHDCSHIVLRPQPVYMPNVPTTPFRNQVVKLQALPSEEADPALALLCPVRALRIYVDRTQSFRSRKRRLSPSRGCPTRW